MHPVRSPSLYDVLGVAPEADPVVVEAAYRALMKKYHPDRYSASESSGGPSAADINAAYAELGDPERRARYDHHLRARLELPAFPPPPLHPSRPPSRRVVLVGSVVAALLGASALLLARGGILPESTRQLPASTPVAVSTAGAPGGPIPFDPFEALRPATVSSDEASSTPGEPERVRRAPAGLRQTYSAAAQPPRSAPAPRARQGNGNGRRDAATRPNSAQPPKARDREFLEREGYIY